MATRHAVIVDDERLARRELRTLLEEGHASELQIVGEAANLEDAAKVIRAKDPDVVFLDIKLGRTSGLDLLPMLSADTEVIFVTAYDRYAIRAFEVNALDYLLKPVVPERLAVAVARLGARAHAPEDQRGPLEYDDRLFLRLNDQRRFLRVGDIVAIEAERDSSILHLGDGQVVTTGKPLREWEERLPERHFLRIHRSAIVNLEHVEKVEDWFSGSYRVHMRGKPEPLTMSRRYGARVRARMG